MKILRVTFNLYPSSLGGVELHAYEMSRLQAQKGHDVTVLTHRTDSGQPPYELMRRVVASISFDLTHHSNSLGISSHFPSSSFS